MLVALYSPKGTYDNTFLANYAYINLVDELTRVPGIAQRAGVRRGAVCDAGLGEAGPAGETEGHGSADRPGAARRRTT